MSEEFLQYIWKYSLFSQNNYIADTGERIKILHVGEHNLAAGPDFTNAKIQIGDTLWAGNCEIHLASSDWIKHNHNIDNAYNNVILHVVIKNDSETSTSNGRIIPTIEISWDKSFEENYKRLLNSHRWVSCENYIDKVDKLYIIQWLTNLAIERLEKRSEEIISYLNKSNNNWEEGFYYFLSRSFGFKVNAVPFEMLARSLPLKILAKHKDNLHQIESLLFGQSGLINDTTDGYSRNLFTEYNFLQKKYFLKPVEPHLWKFMRLRPYNFPTIRIAQFAALINNSSHLFSKILEAENINTLENLFKATASAYWDNHYNFGHQSVNKIKILAPGSIHLLLVNTVIPFIFVYGKMKKLPDYKDKAVSFLENLKPEKNNVINKWRELGLIPLNAFETQALLQLKNEYCQIRKCLSCSIGNRLITKVH